MHRTHAFLDALVGIFHHHDGPVDEHSHGKDQAEHHDVRDGHAHHAQKHETQQERGRDREAHEQRRACAQGRENHDHHQRNGREHGALELADHGGHVAALVIGGTHIDGRAQLRGPGGALRFDFLTHKIGGVDQVEALPLHHLQGHGVDPVEPRRADPVLEGQANIGEIAQRDDPVAVGLDRQVVDIRRIVKGRRDLDREGARFGFNFPRGHQQVVIDDDIDQFARGDVVGLKPQRIDHHLQHLVPLSREPRFEHGVQPFEPVLKVLGDLHQCSFRHVPGQVHDDNREFGEVELVDRVIVGPVRELRLGLVHGGAHIGENLALVPAELELQHDDGVPFGRRSGHLVKAVKPREFRLHRLDEQLFAVLGGDPGERHRDKDRRDLDIRLALFRQAGIGVYACQQGQRDEGEDHPRPRRGPIDETGHPSASSRKVGIT